MKYHLQEGSFQLFPAQWQDTSMTVLRDDESGLSVVVSRGVIPEGSNAEQEFQRQWDVMRTQMGDVQQSEFARVLVGPQRNIRAIEVETAFLRGEHHIWQKQLAVQVPEQAVLLVFTLSALRAFTEQDTARWNAIKQTLTLNDNRNA
ncbi:DUF1795 domain-containing protein [Yokenella regensburgei]|uniref:DcrB-related protein n=1 Tax=Yokenella regensburgei TaxID=158877 RepID=UPI003F15B15D